LETLEVIHISDTHFGPDRDHKIRDSQVCARAKILVEAINDLTFQPDLIVHTGDVVNDPDENSYALAETVLSQLNAPVYYATGNHDDVSMMRKALTFGDHTNLLEPSLDKLCYQIGQPAGDFDFFVVDGKVPESEGPHGYISSDQEEAVIEALDENRPTAIYIHYPLTPIGSKWIDEHLLVKNGEAFQEKIKQKLGNNLRGIFSGHIHRALQVYRDGVLQSGVSSPACEFTAGPEDDYCDFLPGGPIPFNHITFTGDATMVKGYSIPFAGSKSCG